MFSFWKSKKTNQDTPWGPPASVSSTLRSALAMHFSALDQLRGGLGENVLRFVLEAEGEEVLDELRGVRDSGKALGLWCCGMLVPTLEHPSAAVFACDDINQTHLCYRLACVYHSASLGQARGLTQPSLPDWLEIFLREALLGERRIAHISNAVYHVAQHGYTTVLRTATVVAMLELAEQPPELLAQAALQPASTAWCETPRALLLPLVGFEEFLQRHQEIVRDALRQPEAAKRVAVLELLHESRMERSPYLDLVALAAVNDAKTVRERAEAMLDISTCRPFLEEIAQGGTPAERVAALRLLHRLGGDAARDFIQQRSENDPTATVRDTAQGLLMTSEKASPQASSLPTPPVEVNISPLSAATRGALFDTLKTIELYEREHKRHLPGGTLFPHITDALVTKVFEDLQQPQATAPEPLCHYPYMESALLAKMNAVLQRSDVELPHVVRLFLLITTIPVRKQLVPEWPGPGRKLPAAAGVGRSFYDALSHYRRLRSLKFGLREIASVLDSVGMDGNGLGEQLLQQFHMAIPAWEPEAIWPYFADRLPLVVETLRSTSGHDGYSFDRNAKRNKVFQVIRAFPQPPPQLVDALWEISLVGTKAERPVAQRCLQQLPDLQQRLLVELRSGTQDRRLHAAEWLSRVASAPAEAIQALLAALQKERQEAVRGALILALERLGAPTEQFLDRAALEEEARRGLQKGIPATLSWFPFDRLPAVHWTDSGAEVPRDVVRWFLVRAFAQKTPQPGTLLRKYCSYFAEREALAVFTLDAWIAQDTLPKLTPAQAAQQAAATATAMVKWQPNRTYDQHYRSLYQAALGEFKGSAVAEKGILAVVGACAGAAAVQVVNQFIHHYYGTRAAECKALVQMLSWVDHALAVQTLLAISTRFRTRGVQEEAQKAVTDLAERKGWTLEELADRTVPTAGLNEQRELELSYGPRTFRAYLNESMDLAISDPEGRPLKALPAPRQDDDEEEAARSKKLLAAARKEIKALLKTQSERLYVAMCTGRLWPLDDWLLYLARHPLLGSLCQRLVWMTEEGVSFRPMEDGTLLNQSGDEVSIESLKIRLAHRLLVSDADAASWRQHLVDFRVLPAFTQFSQEVYRLSPAKAGDTDLRDFEGYVVEAFKLRGQATKMGYVRGQTGDGGWFYEYRKSFPLAGLEAAIEFSGNQLPEENKPVALHCLYFVQRSAEEAGTAAAGVFTPEARIALGEVPTILLSECHRELAGLAAHGTYQSDWHKVEP